MTSRALATDSHSDQRRQTSLPEHRSQLGSLGEQMAARFLEMRGYRILARNWRHARGELDLVVTDGEAVIAVEVKTRTSYAYGHPFEAITPLKISRLRSLISLWCAEHRPHAQALRIDAIAIVGERGARRTIDHREGIG